MQINFNRYKNNNNPEKAIVAIHGWGGNKDSFYPFVSNLKVDNVEWFLPEGPYSIEDTLPIDSLKKTWTYKKEDGTWEVQAPMIMMDDFFNNVVFKQYDSKNVYVLGFSQGAAVCYEYIMGMEKSLGGIFPIGGFFFKHSNEQKKVSENNKNTPILIGHGIKDKVIPIEKSKIAYNQLLKEGANVKFHSYSGGHKISMNFLRIMMEVINGK